MSGVWLPVLLSAFTPPLLLSVEDEKAAGGAVGTLGAPCGPEPLLPRKPGPTEVQEEGEMGEKREEQRSLTGQKAEPLGMKFTLFLSGHEKRGKPFDLPDLQRTEAMLSASACRRLFLKTFSTAHNANKLVGFVLSSHSNSRSHEIVKP